MIETTIKLESGEWIVRQYDSDEDGRSSGVWEVIDGGGRRRITLCSALMMARYCAVLMDENDHLKKELDFERKPDWVKEDLRPARWTDGLRPS